MSRRRDDRQAAVYSWAVDAFGKENATSEERMRRLVEEVAELAQAEGMGRESFERITYHRAKAKRGRTGKLQRLIVPEPMRAILRAWHELAGRPLREQHAQAGRALKHAGYEQEPQLVGSPVNRLEVLF